MIPPHKLLEQKIQFRRWNMTDAAKYIGISRQALYQILDGRYRISPRIAVGIANAFGENAEKWLCYQASWQLAVYLNIDDSHVAIAGTP